MRFGSTGSQYGGHTPPWDFKDSGMEEDSEEEETEENRLQSLEALRYALHHAPFCKNMHTLMSVPNEECYEMQGIPTKCAIRVEQLCYGNTLDNVNLEVPKGKIYAVLGSANNGKSALLKCIMGHLKPTSGTIVTFGTSPSHSQLSAICVGYMPQEMALHRELTVGQTLHYYARLYQLPLYMIVERVNYLNSILYLPNPDILVHELDHNEQWRLSLAVTLIHSPPLLLLDEPTVKVDPLVRYTVWQRLAMLCEEEGMTVVVTTKYPEEVAFAYKVAMMRNGHVYQEDRPEELCRQYRCHTYHDLYTRFCTSNIPRQIRPSIAPYLLAPAQLSYQTASTSTGDIPSSTCGTTRANTERKKSINSEYPVLNKLWSDLESSSVEDFSPPERLPLPMAEWPICERRRSAYKGQFAYLDVKRLWALMCKNLYVIRGNLMLIIIFYFLFPAIQIIFVCFVFAQTVSNIPVVVSTPSKNLSTYLNSRFFDREIFTPETEPSLETSIKMVVKGQAWAAVQPWTNYNSSHCDQSSLSSSLSGPLFGLRLYLDESNFIINQQMFYSFTHSMRELLQHPTDQLGRLFPGCPQLGQLVRTGHTAIDIAEVIYGSTKFRFLEFLLPGFLVCLVFIYSLVLTAYCFIREHLNGLQARCLATGTSGIEILTSHFMSQTTIFILQESLLLVIVFRLFGLPSRGPFYSLWLLIFLQGLVGICFGLFVAVICPKKLGASLFTSAIFIPAFFMSGVVWPIESMPQLVRYISHALPLTLPINALRYIISRGPDMHYSRIVLGFSLSTTYITLLLLLTIVIFKFKTSS